MSKKYKKFGKVNLPFRHVLRHLTSPKLGEIIAYKSDDRDIHAIF